MDKRIASVSAMLLLVTSALSVLFAANVGKPQQAEAQTSITISGRVTYAGFGLGNVKVWLEAPAPPGSLPHNTYALTDSQGYWTKNVPSGKTYTVDASKYGYNRVRHTTTITTTTPNVNFVLSSQNVRNIDLFVVPDEDFRNAFPSNWQSAVWSKITYKVWVYKDNWNINYVDRAYSSAWNSPGSVVECYTLLGDAKGDTAWGNPSYQSSDMILAYTKQPTMEYAGDPKLGCADGASTSGQHPGLIIKDVTSSSTIGNYVNHEINHNYDYDHYQNINGYYCTQNDSRWDMEALQAAWDHQMAIQSSPRRMWY